MASKTRNVPVKMVRVQWADKTQPITHSGDVTVGIPKDSDTKTTYLRIAVNKQTILSEELDHFQWLDESSTHGVTTINSRTVKIVIMYDTNNATVSDFFKSMEALIKGGSQIETPEPSPQPRKPSPTTRSHIPKSEDHIKQATNDLLRFIQNDSSKEVEHPVRFLAQKGVNIQFNLTDNHDNGENTSATRKPEGGSSSNVLQLTLRIECHLNRDPIVAPIYVRSGTTLRELKQKMEDEMHVKRKDQYWYVFGRYLINDDYEFGSLNPAVPPPTQKLIPKKQAPLPTEPIRNGDTLILYIAQIRAHD